MSVKFAVNFESDGIELTGLSPVIDMLKRLDTESDFTPIPTVNEIANGFYGFQFAGSDGIEYISKIDGGASIASSSNRYKYIKERADNVNETLYVMPTYNADADTLTFMVYLLREGKSVVTGMTNVVVSMYNKEHSAMFEISTTTITNGVAVLTKGTPNLTVGQGYYLVVQAVLTSGDSVRTTESFKVLD